MGKSTISTGPCSMVFCMFTRPGPRLWKSRHVSPGHGSSKFYEGTPLTIAEDVFQEFLILANMVWIQHGVAAWHMYLHIYPTYPFIYIYIYVYMIINMYVGVFLHTSVFIVIQSLLLLLFLLLLSHIIITYYYHVLSCLLIISSPKSFYPNLQGWNIAHMVLLDSIHLCQMKK